MKNHSHVTYITQKEKDLGTLTIIKMDPPLATSREKLFFN